MSNIVAERRFVKTDLVNNNNKFWYIRILDNGNDNYTVQTEWGRVGETGATTEYPKYGLGNAESFMQSRINSKTGDRKGYHEIQVVGLNTDNTSGTSTGRFSSKYPNRSNTPKVDTYLMDLAIHQIAGPDPIIRDLVSMLVKENVHQIQSRVASSVSYNETTGLFQTPCGVIDKVVITEARDLLVKMSDFITNNQLDSEDFQHTVNEYMMMIPQDIGRGRTTAASLYPNINKIQEQSHLLDDLEASYAIAVKPKVDDTKKEIEEKQEEEEKLFFCELKLVEDPTIIKFISDKYQSTLQYQHMASRYKPSRVFSVRVENMASQFETKATSIGNIQKLWHGTRVGNLLSIMKSGFVIPPYNASYCSGRMFGNGVYFSDQSTKSLNYAAGYWSGTRENKCFMFLCDVAMGNAYTPRSYTEKLPKLGYDSTFAKASISGVANNEMIVYNLHQLNPVYLVEFI